MEGLQPCNLIIPKLTQRTTPTRILHTDPSKRRIQIITSVHEPSPCLDLVSNPQGRIRILGPDRSRESEIGIVHEVDGFLVRVDAHDADDGTEGFFGHDAHGVGDGGQDLGCHVRGSGLVGGEEGGVDVRFCSLRDYLVKNNKVGLMSEDFLQRRDKK